MIIKMKRITPIYIWLLVLVIISLIVLMVFVSKEPVQSTASNDENIFNAPTLLFSNTQSWDPVVLVDLANSSQSTIHSLRSQITLPPPPANGSDETKQELEQLIAYESLRTEMTITDIINEVRPAREARFGPLLFNDFYFPEKHPATYQLLDTLFAEYMPLIASLKAEYDRVRPAYLDHRISTVIETPGHPAYPSGHASQVFLVAHVLSDIFVDERDVFFAEAERIAVNREIAGVHYPSDTEAGKRLAEQYYAIVTQREDIRLLIEAAREELLSSTSL
jgi:hypothetical protein